MYQNGKVVDPKEVTVYYGSRLKDPSRTQPFPFGLRMITGNAKNQVDTPDKQGNHFWCAGIGGEIGRSADKTFPVCAKTANIVRQITFPDCWDGKHLDSPDHKAHMANGDHTGACPKSHPVPDPLGVVRDLVPVEREHRRHHPGVRHVVLHARGLLQRVEGRGARRTGAQLPRPGREVQLGR